MLASLKHRKTIHSGLFIFVILLQVLIFSLWYNQNTNENELADSFRKASRQSLIMSYSGEVTKNYFDAEDSFMEYLYSYDRSALHKYRNSLSLMTSYLDSLNRLLNKDEKTLPNIQSKKEKEKKIIVLRKELDSLIKYRVDPVSESNPEIFTLKPYNHKKVMKSISYDTIRSSEGVEKKGFFKRIGNAIAGKYDVEKEEFRYYMTMTFGAVEKTGTPEEQMANIFNSTRQYYEKEFGRLRNTYSNLREIDRELMAINKKILKNSQDIILLYDKSVQESNKQQFEKALENLKKKRSLIATLMIVMSICTGLLLLYSIFAYHFEKKLAAAKIEAEKNLEFKNRIIGMLSHEMRSPLSIISNLTNKLISTKMDGTQNDMAKSLNFTSNSLHITVNQILDFFKNENGKLQLYNSKTVLKNEITSIVESLKSLADAKKIELVSRIDDSLQNEVWADSGKIHQLFYNMIGNAIKFTSKGNITVDCRFTEVNDKFKLDVKIKDTGAGIPKEDLDKIFDKYYQSKFHKDQASFGAGLGLSLCKEIIELYDGEIRVESEPGTGTEISFHLFLEKSDSSQETNQAKLIRSYGNSGIRVAVIDDDRIITTLLKKLLSDINFDMIGFNSDIAAKEYLQKENVNIILTDLQIANASGIDLIKDIKSIPNHNATVPIIAITGDTYMNSIELSSIQADELLIKPINKEELYSKLLKVLSK
ncbi:MAG: response regulator [Flavobacterium lindanitolerans]|uniref:ATP-binding response regulator n=1 Tax=Flavobacterium lindanitolerans TaxID=428988 RepID=UPI001A47260B|nr:hybrid sensor histidine kinase/response regulator [Flavobacterium lindanitolerans]MBL7869710.1 response regulator [Flavobacterium lindanitolerans]